MGKPIWIFEEDQANITAVGKSELKNFNLYCIDKIFIPKKKVIVKHARKDSEYLIIRIHGDNMNYLVKSNDVKNDYIISHVEYFWNGARSVEAEPLTDDTIEICKNRGIKVFTARHWWPGNSVYDKIHTMYHASSTMTDEEISAYCLKEEQDTQLELENFCRKEKERESVNNRALFIKI